MAEPSGRRWARIFKPDARSEIDDELGFHLERRVRDNIARGMDPESARAAAEQRLGALDAVRKECAELLTAERRTEARRDWLRISWLDFKLGMRMLVKYPVLTLVGGFAMAFAIWVGAGTFEFVRQIAYPALPLPNADRIVALRNWDAKSNQTETRALPDFVWWRAELKSVEALGAYRTVQRNLAIGSVAEPIGVAEISASAFRVARVRPLMGRTLMGDDELANAPAVAVIGFDLWRERFDGDPHVVGRTVKLGSVPTTIVGIMPEAYGFPMSHGLWVPFRLDALEYKRGEGPGIRMFGLLARRASIEDAQAELTALGRRAAADFPETHEHLRPQVMPYKNSFLNLSGPESVVLMGSINVFLVALLGLMCSNVALLMFARAATRESEIMVRSALGASKGRIVVQLFAEALVLGALAAVIGLAAAGYGLRWAMNTVILDLFDGNPLPFWFRATLSPATIAYAALLTFLAAIIAGVLPALKATRGLQSRLRAASAGGALGFGGVWTAVIVIQIASTVAFPFVAFEVRREAIDVRDYDVGIPDRDYLTARLDLDRFMPDGASELPAAEFAARYNALYRELERRLEAESAVTSVTFGQFLPRMYHPHRLVDVDAGGAAPLDPRWPAYRVSSASVAVDYFDALDVPILAGRTFRESDIGSDHGVIIVNESFVQRVLGGRNPIGRRVQYKLFEDRYPRQASAAEPWFEIIGVVRDLGTSESNADPKVAAFYHPAEPANAHPAHLAIHVKNDPMTFAPRLRAIAHATNPDLRVYNPKRLAEVTQDELKFYSFWFRLTLMVSAIALLLSLAGIYAVMSFTVSRRTREIGIRVALGSRPLPIVIAILRRPLIQVGLGIVGGAVFMAVLPAGLGGSISTRVIALLGVDAVLTTVVCMLACIVPARRALRVQPMDALRVDA